MKKIKNSMKGIIVFCLLLILIGCGKGYPFDNYSGEECCRDHGGGGVCFYNYNYTHGYLAKDDHGHITCDGKYTAADGKQYNYSCPGECK